jgi:hypothetical protein
MHAHAHTQVRGHGAPLGQDVLEVQIRRDVAQRDAPEVDRIVACRVLHQAVQTVLEALLRVRTEGGAEIRKTEQHAHLGRDESVVEPHSAGRRALDVVAAQGPDVELDGAEP